MRQIRIAMKHLEGYGSSLGATKRRDRRQPALKAMKTIGHPRLFACIKMEKNPPTLREEHMVFGGQTLVPSLILSANGSRKICGFLGQANLPTRTITISSSEESGHSNQES